MLFSAPSSCSCPETFFEELLKCSSRAAARSDLIILIALLTGLDDVLPLKKKKKKKKTPTIWKHTSVLCLVVFFSSVRLKGSTLLRLTFERNGCWEIKTQKHKYLPWRTLCEQLHLSVELAAAVGNTVTLLCLKMEMVPGTSVLWLRQSKCSYCTTAGSQVPVAMI